MKAHTQDYKDRLIYLGKEINGSINYTIDNVSQTITAENLTSVTPHYEGALLKSVMKQLDFTSPIEVPTDTIVNFKFGLKIGNSYEYVDYGNYIVKEVERQEDTNTYLHKCYDKMLYAMKDYEELEIEYPITIRDYLSALCNKLEIEFANADDDFTNYNQEVKEDLFKDLGYTYRDILDQLAEATASTICINKDDKLEVRYLSDSINSTNEVEGTNLTITDGDEFHLLDYVLYGDTTQVQTTQNANLFDEEYYRNTTYTSNVYKWTNARFKGNRILYFKAQLKSGKTAQSGAYIAISDSPGMAHTGLSAYALRNGNTVNEHKDFTNVETLYVNIYPNNLDNATIFDNYNLWVSTDNVSYVPFIPDSPSPDYPSEVKTITRNQEIYTSSKNKFSGLVKGIAINSVNGAEATNVNSATSDYIPVNFANNQRYYLSGLTNTLNSFVGAYNSNKVFLGRTNATAVKNWALASNVFTNGTPQGTGDIAYIRVIQYKISTNTGTIDDVDNLQIMLNEGNSALPYEPYKGKKYEVVLSSNNLQSANQLYEKLYNYNSTGLEQLNDGGIEVIKFSNTKYRCEGAGNTFTFYENWKENTQYTIRCRVKRLEETSASLFFVILYTDNTTSLASVNSLSYTELRIVSTAGKTIKRVGFSFGNESYYYLDKSSWFIGEGNTTDYDNYVPYNYKLCKIGTYKDSIFKGVGKNLANVNKAETTFRGIPFSASNGIIYINGTTTSSGNSNVYFDTFTAKSGNAVVSIEVGGYTDKDSNNSSVILQQSIDNGVNWTTTQEISLKSTYTKSYSVVLNSTYLYRFRFYATADTTFTNSVIKVQLEYGSTKTSFEPYNAKGKWVLEKNIGKVVIDGTEDITQHKSTGIISVGLPISNNALHNTYVYSNYFKYEPFSSYYDDNGRIYGEISTHNASDTNTLYASSPGSDYNTLTTFKNWFTTHNTIVYYVMATPTYEIIDNEYLIKDLNNLEKAVIYRDVANVSSTIPLKFSYATDYETIDEEYIKNTRAEFSEEYGPINSIVLSRSAESDNIYLQDEESIAENGLTELKIKDNQFMNDNDRDNYLPGILSRLDGLRYYPTDFESIGITYLDLCDKYRCKVRGKYYDTIMLNNEVEVSSGLNEIIYCDPLLQTQTDYKKADTTDRRINQAYIIVDKQNQEIETLTSRTNSLETKQTNDKNELLDKFGDYALQGDVAELTTQVHTLQTDTFTKTEVKSILKGTFTDSSGQVVPELVRTTSATFDENGMLYEKTNAKTNTRINEVGMKVNNSTNNTELMFAGYDNNTNQTIVRSENMTVKKYFVVGSYSRLEDYKTGTGVFDI